MSYYPPAELRAFNNINKVTVIRLSLIPYRIFV